MPCGSRGTRWGSGYDTDRVSEGRLQIQFQRSGGVTGIPIEKTVDTGELPPAEAEELGRLVDRADLPSMARREGGPPGGRPDRFQYDLAVTVGDRRYQVTVHEPDIPDNMKPLIDRLNDLARRR
jgi:hypothetical protein